MELPSFDVEAVRKKTYENPTGYILVPEISSGLSRLLYCRKRWIPASMDRGVVVAEGFDYEIIDKAYRPYDNLSLLVVLKSDGTIQKQVIASVTESLKADKCFADDWKRLEDIFENPSLQMISFHDYRKRIFCF